VKCSEFLHELTNYLDGVIDNNTKVELENHLSWCHNCYVVCDTTKKTIEIYRDSQLYELPEDLRSRLRSAIMTKRPPRLSASKASYAPPSINRLGLAYNVRKRRGVP
jgi:predicted anti-sigma-YlaC factor YlaD